MSDDLRRALARTQSKPLREGLERTFANDADGRRPGPTFRAWKGSWLAERRYSPGDVVEHNGSSWRCLVRHRDSEPPSVKWELVAQKGQTGVAGARGFIGPTGPPGPGGEVEFFDEGVSQGTASDVDIVGAGGSVSVAGNVATITIPGGGDFAIPQLNADPVAPDPESAWVRRTGGLGGGEVKFLFGGGNAITTPGAGSTYEFSYRTLQNTTVRVALT